MTASDHLPTDEWPTDDLPADGMTEAPGPSTSSRVVRIIAALIGLVFIGGVFAGFLEARQANGNPPYSLLAIAAVTLLGAVGAGCLWVMLNNLRLLKSGVEQLPRRERTSTWITIIAMSLGGVTGMAYSLTDHFAPGLLFDAQGRILAPLAIAVALIWGLAGPLLTRWWLGQTDEHERAAYAEGGNWAAHAMLFGVPIWWLLWKAGLASEPSAIDSVVAATFLWLVVWVRRKFY